MSYYIKKLSWKKSDPKWKVQFVSYKNEHIENAKAKKPRKTWDVKRDRWKPLGFYPCMSFEEARGIANKLNSQIHLKRQEVRISSQKKKETEFRRKYDSILPKEFVEEFERYFIRKRDSETENGRRRTSRARSIWRAAQKMMIEGSIPDTSFTLYSGDMLYTSK